ncbi:MAG: glycogen/starch synthase, partial [Simkaniaceae bacterium]|nr:glycogen/starch synthase [Simkaniaceae bacterium]
MIPPVCTMRRNAPNCDCEIQTFMGECELLNRNFPLFPNKAAKHEQLRVYQDHQSLVQALVDELRSPAHTQGSLWECLLKLEPEDRAALEIAYECSPVMLDFIRNRVPLEELNEAYKAKIIEIQRVGINEPFLDCHRDELKNFIDLLKDPSKAVDDHRRGFDSLHKDIKEYLFYIVYITWRGELGDVGFNFGEERILGDPSLLLGLLTPSGDSFLGELLEILDVQHDLHCVEQALSGLIAENQTLSPDLQILSLKTKDLQDLCLRMGEKSPRFNHLAEQFCMSLDAPVEDRLNYLSQLQALIEKVAGDFSFDSCRGRAKQLRYLQQVGPKTFHYTKTSMEKVRVASNRTQAGVLNLLIVSYELGNRWGIKFGGLGEAVASRVAALKMRGHNVTVISPDFRYRQTPNGERRIPELSTPETTCERMTYNINGQEKLLNVHSTQTDTGIELVRLDGGPEQFFDICGNSTGIYQDGHHGVGKDKWYGLKERMAYFGAVCAAYLEKRLKYEALDPNSLKTDVIEFNDWHGALAIDLLYKEVKSKFHGGKISEDSYYKGNNLPAIVFVCHNNCFGAQGVFRGDEAEIVANFGGEAGGFNVAQRALERSDMSLTVSRTFAEEMQTEVLGAGMEQWVRRAAHSGRFKGIINGSNPTGYDPSTSPQLTGWVDPETQVHTPLAYSTESQNIAGHRKVMKKQLGKWITAYGDPKAKAFLEKCGGTDSLVEKDVVYFVGR